MIIEAADLGVDHIRFVVGSERIRDLVITEISVYGGSAVVEKVDNQFRMKP